MLCVAIASAAVAARGGVRSAELLADMPEYSHITMSAVSADCRNVAMVVGDATGKPTLLLNGKPIATGQDIPLAVISPDGKRLAYVVREATGKWHAVVDGVAGETYDSLRGVLGDNLNFTVADRFAFSADSKHLAYVGQKEDKQFVVMDSKAESQHERVLTGDPDDGRMGYVLFSPDGRRYAYVTLDTTRDSATQTLIVDGNKFKTGAFGYVSFSPDSKHIAYDFIDDVLVNHFYVDDKEIGHCRFGRGPVISDDGKHTVYAEDGERLNTSHIVLDGKEGPRIAQMSRYSSPSHFVALDVEQLTFSPDGKHLAFDQQEPAGPSHVSHINLDGVEGKEEYVVVGNLTFSPDSRDLACAAMGGVMGGPPEWRIVLNGKDGQTFDFVLPPVFSPDSKHLAYAARKAGKWAVVLDGQTITTYEAIISRVAADDVDRAPGWVDAQGTLLEKIEPNPFEAFSTPYRFDSDGNLIFLGSSAGGKIFRVKWKPDDGLPPATTRP